MIDIDQIIFELFCRAQIIAAIDLCVTSQARHNLHTAAEVLDFAVKVVINSCTLYTSEAADELLC